MLVVVLPVIWPFLISLLVTLVSVPLTIRLAKRFGLIDDPSLRPHPAHSQIRVIPRAGGLPVFVGILLASLIFIPLDKHLLGILLALFLLLVIGLLDDKLRNFSPLIRLLFQFLAAGIVVASGIGISFVGNPLGGGVMRLDQIIIPFQLFGPHRIIPIADLFAFFWIVWMMNIVNWSKGVDGQMPGIIFVGALTIGFVSLKLWTQGDPNQLTIAEMSFITSGAALGLLIFNWHPSKILPAFSASTILGTMIAVLSILSGAKVATALLVLLIPTMDFIYTLMRRLLSGKPPMLGDRGHLHHRLLNLGWSHQQISLFYIGSCAILGLLATLLPSTGKLFTSVTIGIVTLGALVWLHLFTKENL